MPSYEQFEELINSSYTTTELTTQNGVNGRKITSKINGNSIFLPAAGYRLDSSHHVVGSCGYYWSRTLLTGSPESVLNLLFLSNLIYSSYYYRVSGQSVRPVRASE